MEQTLARVILDLAAAAKSTASAAGEPEGGASPPRAGASPPAVSEPEDANRRNYPRLPNPPLFVSGLWATVADVSEGGMCLLLRESVQPGERYDLILTNGIFPYTLECQVEIMWVRRGKAGVRFVEVTAQQEIWLRERFREWLKERRNPVQVLRRAEDPEE